MLNQLDPQTLGPLLAALFVFGAAVGLPVPTLPALIYAGSVIVGSAQPVVSAALSFGGAWAGAIAGDSLWYWAGRRYGHRVLSLLCRMSLSRDRLIRHSRLRTRWP